MPDDLLEAVAVAMAGENGCCEIRDADGRCCHTQNAREIFKVIGDRTGLTLEWLEGAERIQDAKRAKQAKQGAT